MRGNLEKEKILEIQKNTVEFVQLINNHIDKRRQVGDPDFKNCPLIDLKDPWMEMWFSLSGENVKIGWKEYHNDSYDVCNCSFAVSELWEKISMEEFKAKVEEVVMERLEMKRIAKENTDKLLRAKMEETERKVFERLKKKFG